MADNQFYFSKQCLKDLLDNFETARATEASQKDLKGFVFTLGKNQDGVSKVFAFPLFSDNAKAGADGDILIQNTTYGIGCPYPPKCNDGTNESFDRAKDSDKSCYGA